MVMMVAEAVFASERVRNQLACLREGAKPMPQGVAVEKPGLSALT